MVAGVADPTLPTLAYPPNSASGKRVRTRSPASDERESQNHDPIQRAGAGSRVARNPSSLLQRRPVGPHLRRSTEREECRKSLARLRDARVDGAWGTRLRARYGACPP